MRHPKSVSVHLCRPTVCEFSKDKFTFAGVFCYVQQKKRKILNLIYEYQESIIVMIMSLNIWDSGTLVIMSGFNKQSEMNYLTEALFFYFKMTILGWFFIMC